MPKVSQKSFDEKVVYPMMSAFPDSADRFVDQTH
jgi:hypothetical protein